MNVTGKNLASIFTHHPPFGDQVERYNRIREAARHFAQVVADNAPQSREQSVAYTNIQQAMMWANAAIAINEEPLPVIDAEVVSAETV